MRLPSHPTDHEATAQVEGLLRSAAAYEVPLDPPGDLTTRALARWERRRARRRRLRAGLVTALSIGMGALAVTWLRGGSPPPQQIAAAPRPSGVRRPVAALHLLPSAHPSSDAATRVRGSAEGDASSALADPGGDPKRRRVAALQSVAAAGLTSTSEHRRAPSAITSRREPHLRPRPPRAHWDVQVVQRDVAGVLAPVWLVQADDERGELLVTPAVLQIQTKLAVFEGATGSTENDVPVIEPTSPEGDHPANAR